MLQWTLKPYTCIEGLSSVSGLHWLAPDIYLMADNSSYLYHYQPQIKQLNKIGLTAHPQDSMPKRVKHDFESLLYKDNQFYLFGSGSRPNRMQCVCHDLATGQTRLTDLTPCYDRFRQVAGLEADELNIEGVVYVAQQQQWWFFQRGNGQQALNGIFILSGEALVATALLEFIRLDLPPINHFPSSFTDAVLVGTDIYFLAAAENSGSTYADGEIMGSQIGRISTATRQVDAVVTVSGQHKFEGISLLSRTEEQLVFLLGEDNDQHDAATTLYTLHLCL